MSSTRQQQIRGRRRMVVCVGWAALALLTATACIFDQSNYQGGGRADRGATVKTADPAPTDSITPTPTADASDGAPKNPITDAADAG